MAVGTFLRMLETCKTILKQARNFAPKRLICVDVSGGSASIGEQVYGFKYSEPLLAPRKSTRKLAFAKSCAPQNFGR